MEARTREGNDRRVVHSASLRLRVIGKRACARAETRVQVVVQLRVLDTHGR